MLRRTLSLLNSSKQRSIGLIPEQVPLPSNGFNQLAIL
jgi:hypothetical protein